MNETDHLVKSDRRPLVHANKTCQKVTLVSNQSHILRNAPPDGSVGNQRPWRRDGE